MTGTLVDANARLTRISELVREHSPKLAERDEPFLEAAVALILRPTAHGVELLFIKRATRDDDPWSGQIALPGGRHDMDDESLEATAVRETFEEVDLDLRAHGTIIGALHEVRPRTPVLPPVIVRPFVAIVPADVALVPSLEVAELFWAPLDRVFDPHATRDTDIVVRGLSTRRPAIHYRGHIIWGMTEQILRSLSAIIA